MGYIILDRISCVISLPFKWKNINSHEQSTLPTIKINFIPQQDEHE